jgi:hypothetical protein
MRQLTMATITIIDMSAISIVNMIRKATARPVGRAS